MREKSSLGCLAFLIFAVCALPANAQSSETIYRATLLESDQKTQEVSTEELRNILAEKSATHHYTRVILFGKTAEQAKAVAEAIAKEAFHNVCFFEGSFEQFKDALGR